MQKNWRRTSFKPASQKVVLISNSWVKFHELFKLYLVKVVLVKSCDSAPRLPTTCIRIFKVGLYIAQCHVSDFILILLDQSDLHMINVHQFLGGLYMQEIR